VREDPKVDEYLQVSPHTALFGENKLFGDGAVPNLTCVCYLQEKCAGYSSAPRCYWHQPDCLCLS
jgi:hypothetical protein